MRAPQRVIKFPWRYSLVLKANKPGASFSAAVLPLHVFMKCPLLWSGYVKRGALCVCARAR